MVVDARGHFPEPHTDVTVPLGTPEVRRSLQDVAHDPDEDEEVEAVGLYPTHGPAILGAVRIGPSVQ